MKHCVRFTDRLAIACCLGVVAVQSIALQTYADGLRNPPESATAMGMVGARYTLIEDASAAAFNPANLVGVERASGLIEGTVIFTETEFDAPDGRSGETQGDDKYLGNVFVAFPFPKMGMVAGLGVTTPFGLSTEWAKNGPFKFVAPDFAELRVINFNPTLAAKLGEHFSVGAGVDVFYSDIELRQFIPFSATLMAPVPDGRISAESEGVGVGGNFGVTWRPTQRQRLAATYRLPIEVEYDDGTTKIRNIPPPAAGLIAPRSDFNTEIDFPGILGLGYGLEVTDKFRVGVDVEWIEWSRFDSLPVDLGVNNAAGLFPPAIPQDWEDTWNVGVGAEWDFLPMWALRAGWIFTESPIPEETFSPTIPDADRHIFSVGLGFESAHHVLDVSYAFNLFDDLDVSGNIVPAFDGDYDIDSHLLALSYAYQF